MMNLIKKRRRDRGVTLDFGEHFNKRPRRKMHMIPCARSVCG